MEFLRTREGVPRILGLLVILTLIISAGIIWRTGAPQQSQPAVLGATKEKERPVSKPSLQHATLSQSTNAQLRLLSTYEKQLNRGLERLMVFRAMPKDPAEAREYAAATAPILTEFAKQGIEPLVVFEPGTLDIRAIDRKTLDTYFAALKAAGVSGQTIGTWVPFPEPNIPAWGDPAEDKGNTDPELFKVNYTKTVQALHHSFPEARAMVLLDSATYPTHDITYQHASYNAEDLLRYVRGLPPELVQELGMQGFPWEPDAFDPTRFLDARLAIAAAESLGVDTVSLNSGTFATMAQTSLTVPERRTILSGILGEAQKIQDAGLDVSINIFAENKSDVEADWSYTGAEAETLLKHFSLALTLDGIGLSIFDTAPVTP